MRFTVLEDDMIKRASYVFCNSKIALRGPTVDGVQQFVAYQLTSVISHTKTVTTSLKALTLILEELSFVATLKCLRRICLRTSMPTY